MMKEPGRVAVITGAAQGMGAQHARHLAATGTKVVLADMNEKLGLAVSNENEASGGTACFVSIDVASQEDGATLSKCLWTNSDVSMLW